MSHKTKFRKRFHANVLLHVGILILLTGFVTVLSQNTKDDSQLADLITLKHESDDNLLSIQFSNVTIQDGLEILADKINVGFSYNPDDLPNKRVSFSMVNVPGLEVIYRLLEGTNLEPVLPPTKDVIILRKKEAKIEFDVVQETITGTVVDASTGEALPGVNILIEGTGTGTTTNVEGEFELSVPDMDVNLVFSYIGYVSQVISLEDRTHIEVALRMDVISADELVVVGYGVQRRSDLTGSVASVSSERIENMPYQNISQVLQGTVPGVMVRNTSAGSDPGSSIMVRGRNSITADNSPLIVVDGVPYEGSFRDINTNDVESIEVLRDASAAAIYGARGSNGVILITTKGGTEGATTFSYRGNFSVQNYANLPDLMDGEQFYQYKMERFPGAMTNSERQIYESGDWVDWLDLGTRTGISNEHDIAVSGGSETTTFYLSGNILDVKGIILNDNYSRLSGRVNLDTRVTDWLSFGTRTQISYGDRSGESPELSGGRGLFRQNPLTSPIDEDGNYTVYPWSDDTYFGNPLANTTFDNINKYTQLVTNNFAQLNFPFLDGLSYRLNTGVRLRNSEYANYKARNTREGLQSGGEAELNANRNFNITLENIANYLHDIGDHSIGVTAVFSFEDNQYRAESTEAIDFPNDIISWHALEQAGYSVQNTSVSDSYMISQMLRLNYVYDSRYMITLTGRRDGYSGFGDDNKWGLFPSIALGWNLHNESFFPMADLFSEFKPRVSLGVNGNHAVSPYQSLSRLSEQNMMYGSAPAPGYSPSSLANENLGWETSRTLNIGLDLGLFNDRITSDINYYYTNTYDLLLQRTISSVHGITSILQNIGETKNTGLEMALTSRNIVSPNFMWTTSGNLSFNRNEIVDLYGDGRDDIANSWFIGHPINVNFDYVVDGVWQLDEADEAAEWGSQPGFVKLRDVNGDGQLGPDDRQIIGQQDPKFMWGINNTFNVNNFELNVFIHGVHGVTRYNTWLSDDTWADVRINTTNKNWWTPDNPTNEWIKNDLVADYMSGIQASWYEDASFIRLKDVTLSYNVPQNTLNQIGFNRLRLFITGTNLYTFTKWSGLDPELTGYASYPLEREFVLGISLGL
ncbi:TonB-dependent receptor [Rhodohalobacter sp. SW132]|uniref:SusC/RagA family TonB-linked outer membrane protein n=1 Tax=Rhodohalobacter sp. SW132 TaxID=2293433 RepID=UPI000E286DDF|nr:TonB-dependent receptor [Rhodohalobacter sp. SW132]REL32946.1 TonB-dependent receptor [Rhodohalobacter sp. SW132]